jgi:ribose transport system permease protein
MTRRVSRIFSEYGMILMLLLLCAFFSVVTYSEQNPTGETAAKQLASDLLRQPGKVGRVLIVVRSQADDAVFSRTLEEKLSAGGVHVAGVVSGEPRDAREALKKLSASGEKLDAIAGNQVTASWLVFADLGADFPSLGHPRIVKPRSYKWPNFLKSENLLNIANQIAVIAIVAIGMTMVIITSGIDLSVGSLIALSAVLAALFIRDYAGALHATAFGMTAACAFAVLLCGLVGVFSGGMVTLCDIPPFIVTLAMLKIGSGFAYRLSEGQSIYQLPASFVWLGRGASFLGIPNAVLLMLSLYAAAHVLMSRMKLGRHLYAVGGNRLRGERRPGGPRRRCPGIPTQKRFADLRQLLRVLRHRRGRCRRDQPERRRGQDARHAHRRIHARGDPKWYEPDQRRGSHPGHRARRGDPGRGPPRHVAPPQVGRWTRGECLIQSTCFFLSDALEKARSWRQIRSASPRLQHSLTTTPKPDSAK